VQGRVIIDISPTRVLVALQRRGGGGGVSAFRAQDLDAREWQEKWPGWLSRATVPVKGMLAELQATGAEATIVYAAPLAASAVFSCPVGAGPAAAENAARLALAEQTGHALHDQPCDFAVLGQDRLPRGGGGAAGPSEGSAQRHVLACTDRAESAAAVAQWAHSVGVNPVRLVPDDALALACGLDAALREGSGPPRALLWLGERCSVLACAADGRLRFIRVVRIGTAMLADALTRPIRRGEGAEPLALDRPAAERLLERTGIPGPRDELAELGVTGSALLPLLQPVLQRIGVELKQSLRFGLSEAERAGATLTLTGPGGSIPGLLKVLAEFCAIPASAETRGAAGAAEGAIATGSAGWTALGRADVNLLPAPLQATRVLRTMRRAVWSGAMVASLLLGGHALMVMGQLDRANDEAEAVGSRLAASSDATALAMTAVRALEQRAATDARIGSAMGVGVPWDAVLSLLADAAPEGMHLTSVQGVGPAGAMPTLDIAGHVERQAGVDPALTLREFVSRLAASPIVRGARLGSTQRSSARGLDTQRFEVSLTLAPVPAARPSELRTEAPTASAAGAASRPSEEPHGD